MIFGKLSRFMTIPTVKLVIISTLSVSLTNLYYYWMANQELDCILVEEQTTKYSNMRHRITSFSATLARVR